MNFRIIADSCCDLTPEMKNDMGILSVPLTMTMGDKEFLDDDQLDRDGFIDEMKGFPGKISSASPPPILFQEAIGSADDAFIVTLSDKLSGTYGSAVIGNNMAMSEGIGAACIFDSKTASAGETLIVIKLHELIRSGMAKDKIIETINRYIDNMKTYFVLENYDNLQKNGRLRKVTGTLIQILNIKLIMGDDGNGEIALFEKCRGTRQVLSKFISLIEKSGKETQNENLVISHCNNSAFAGHLATLIRERFDFKNIFIVPTSGISSMYTDDKGIVFAF